MVTNLNPYGTFNHPEMLDLTTFNKANREERYSIPEAFKNNVSKGIMFTLKHLFYHWNAQWAIHGDQFNRNSVMVN